MAAVITSIRPTTEVQAVNVMLTAIGEAPLAASADLSTLTGTDANVEMAVELLKESTREVLTAGWRFNTLTGYPIGPTAEYSWEDTDGVTTVLNVFKRPVDVLAWEMTRCSEMQGLDIIERQSLKYTEAAAKVLVLFDRVRNRDGAEKARYPYLYLDVVTAVDFESMPESARRASTVIAARRLCQRLAASDQQAAFTAQDEAQALRVLKREQGISEPLNLFNTQDSLEIAGRRQFVGGGGAYVKVYPGGA